MFNCVVYMLMKVVHPQVKRFLRNSGVLVLDRLGHSITRQLLWQTSAQQISAPFTSVSSDQFGHLSQISRQVINDRSYVCFEGGPRPVHTLVLCALTEEAGQELKQVTTAGYRVVQRALSERVGLLGAGAWQRHLASYLSDRGRERAVELSQRLGCGRCDVMSVSDCMADSLQRVARLVEPSRSPWQQQQPGVTSSSDQPAVLDVMSVCVGALKTAVSITQSLLKLQFHTAAGPVGSG